MNPVAWLGIDLAVIGLVIVAIELALITPRVLRLTKRVGELNLLLTDNVRLTNHELKLLHESRAETDSLLRPFRRAARWVGHPVTLALLESYRRRRAARRSPRPGL